MQVTLNANYGKIQSGKYSTNVYTVIDEGYDWFLLSNGYYVFKNTCRII